ncbi:MAG: NAD-dependent protein deacetylase of SIR2 family [uncultured Sulfurovum sp.]|uniref:protein acetyllysine N-acetyltransferase n=1 Tax=uncultured Sulfurovum sp. TaxID=269237 RepID=A0A6S6U051_9BACT|nr:MAG: NAD-dependent protein deacetylase of SIR2 family [uncultured Sulfurovum sp.]
MILSGAGLSEESGINTFRDSDGLWEKHDVMKVCSTEGWIENRRLVTQFYNERRVELESKEPNYAHKTLVELERAYRGRVFHLTQNVDDLMDRAGSRDVVHLHGTLTDLRCEACTKTFFIGYTVQESNATCPHCGNKRVRHNVVMFGETAPEYVKLQEATKHSTLLIVIGRSGIVIDLVPIAKAFKHSIIIDPKRQETRSQFDPHKYIDEYFEYFFQKKASEAMDEMMRIVRKHMKEDLKS